MSTTFSKSAPKNGAFLVYINGIEVPATRVNVRYGVWQIPECQVQMVPDPTLIRLGYEDRVQLQVFYLDDTAVDPSVTPQFRLLFDGEITGWGYQTTSSGRAITFTAVNQIAIFTQLFVQFLTTFDDLTGQTTAPGQGITDVDVASSQIVFPFVLFKQGILAPTPQQAATQASQGTGATSVAIDPSSIVHPFDFIYNVVRGMIGLAVPSSQRTVPAANFFTRWDRLTNFHNRFAASPFFDEATDNRQVFPVLKALQNVSAVDTIARNLLPMVQNKGSLWDMIQGVYQTVLMEVAMIPTMPLVAVDLTTNLVQKTNFAEQSLMSVTSSMQDSSSVVGVTTQTVGIGSAIPQVAGSSRAKLPRRIPSYFAKPQFLFGIPPSCNVIFPSQLKTMVYEENYATQPTRMYFNDETLLNLFHMPKTGLGEQIHNALSIAWPLEADAILQAKNQSASLLNGKDFLLYPEEFFKGPVMDRRDVPPWLFFLKRNELDHGQPKGVSADNQVVAPNVPSQTAAVPPPSPTTTNLPTGVLVTNGRVGTANPPGSTPARKFDRSVENLRTLVSNAAMPKGIPVDFALAWIQTESDGQLTATDPQGHSNDVLLVTPGGSNIARGYFQLLAENAATVGVTSAQFPQLSTSQSLSLSTGIQYIYKQYQKALQFVQQQGLNWLSSCPGDVWRLAKMFFNEPAALTNSTIPHGVTWKQAVAALGHTPANWAELYPYVQGKTNDPGNAWTNATAVGGVVDGASGTMITAQDPKPFTAPGATAAPASASSAASAPITPQAPSAPSAADTLNALASTEDVYHLYAKYEYFRERYARRSGSAQLIWSPQVAPGFPGMIFDHRSSRVDLCVYVTTVQQTMSASGERSTTLSFMYGRQLQEMFDLMAQEFELGEAALGAGPAEPIRDIRKIIQSFTQSEQYYQRVFYGAQSLYGKAAAFDFRNIIGYAPQTPGGSPVSIFVNGPEESAEDDSAQAQNVLASLLTQQQALMTQISSYQSGIDTAQGVIDSLSGAPDDPEGSVNIASANSLIAANQAAITQATAQLATINTQISTQQSIVTESSQFTKTPQVTHNLVGNREIVPLPAAQPLFNSYDAAMRYCWRPICSLDEYVTFLGTVGEGQVPALGHPQSLGAPYYSRIRMLTPAASDPATGIATLPIAGADGLGNLTVNTQPQTAAQQGAVDPQTGVAAQAAAQTSQAPGITSTNFPNVRNNWDAQLIAYRNNVRNVKVPRT